MRMEGIRQSIVPEVVYQRVVVQVASTCHLADWAISSGGRCRAQGTCVRGNISMRMERKSTVDRARGVYQRVVVQVASTYHLADWASPRGGRFPARGTCVRGNLFMRMEGNLSVGRARGGVSESCRTSRLYVQLSRLGDFVRRKVSSTRYMCPWEHFHAYGEEIDGRSCPRCVSESCRTSRFHVPLSRLGESARRKVSSTWYMCPWEPFHAYGGEFVGRSCPRWCIRELSYKSPPAAT